MGDNRWATECITPVSRDTDQQTTSTQDRKPKTVLYVGQPQNIFCRGAKFDGISKLQIPPPPPGCPPNEIQSMLMNNEGHVYFTPSYKRLKEPGKFPIKSNNKITPKVAVVAEIKMAPTPNILSEVTPVQSVNDMEKDT
ncbi:mitogen-activated protein kinase kinase kinase binding [Mactra antiquata]